MEKPPNKETNENKDDENSSVGENKQEMEKFGFKVMDKQVFISIKNENFFIELSKYFYNQLFCIACIQLMSCLSYLFKLMMDYPSGAFRSNNYMFLTKA